MILLSLFGWIFRRIFDFFWTIFDNPDSWKWASRAGETLKITKWTVSIRAWTLMKIAFKNGSEIEEKGSRTTIKNMQNLITKMINFWINNWAKIGSKMEPKSKKKRWKMRHPSSDPPREPKWGQNEAKMRLRRLPWGALGASWGSPGVSCGVSWGALACSGGSLSGSLGGFWVSWGAPGSFWPARGCFCGKMKQNWKHT